MAIGTPKTLGPWPAGINNRQPDYAMPVSRYGRVIGVQNAVNADLTADGHFRRRKGFSKVVSGVGFRSGFSCAAGEFVVEGSQLKRWNADGTFTTIYSSVAGNECSFDYELGVLYFADGNRVLKIDGTSVSTISIPAGTIVRRHNGRVYSVRGSVVWFTEPYEDHANTEHGFLQMPETVTVFEPVSDGIWIVADKTYFLSGGDPFQMNLLTRMEHGAIPGTSVRLPDNNVCWQSEKGTILAGPGGEIKNLTQENLAPDTGLSGAGLYREENGVRAFVTTISDAALPSLAADSFMTMEVVRREGS